MRNSKKNKGNDLLPQRKPKLGKFILLAVILHVVFAIFLIHFYKKKPEEVPGIKVKSQKVISKPLAKEVLHTVRPESSASVVTESRPMSPEISVAFEDRTPSVLLAHKRARKPRLKVKSQNVISQPLASEVLQTVRPEISASVVTESRPMSSAISMAFEDRTPSVPPPHKLAWKPIPFYKKKYEIAPGIEVKSRKVISMPSAQEVLHADRAESSASVVTESRPVSPAISMAFEDRTPSVLLAHKWARKPRVKVKSRKVISRHLAKEVLHSVRPEISTSVVTESRPMSPAISMTFEDRTPSIPLAHKQARKPRIKVKSRKVISRPLAYEVLHTVRPEISASVVTESRPMSPAISMTFKDRTPSVALAHKRARKPITLHMPALEPTPGIKSKTLKVMTVMAGNLKSNADHLVPTRKMPVNSRLAAPRQVKDPLPSKIVGTKPITPVLETFTAQMRIIKFEDSDKRTKTWPIERADRAEVQLAFHSERHAAFPKIPRSTFQVSVPSLHAKTGAFEKMIKTKGLTGQPVSGSVRTGTLEKTSYLNSRTVSSRQAKATLSSLEPSAWFSKTRILPKTPPTPTSLTGNIAEQVNRLIRPSLEKYAGQKVRVLAKNLTYRDKGLESEGSKFFSGLVRAAIEKLERVELLSPSDISKTPHIELDGQIWDNSKTVSVHLRIKESKTNRKLNTAGLEIGQEQFPEKVDLKPPEGESLEIIRSVVALMKQIFPRRGDFQLSVWPDKGFDAVFEEGERFMINILPEKDAYLQVDYYQVDGKVVHLLPNPHESNFVEGGKPFIIGKSGSAYEFIVEAPFGEELLMVVASQEPILAVYFDIVEPAEPYLKRLARNLRKQRTKGLMAGAHYIVLTKARELENSITPIGSKTE